MMHWPVAGVKTMQLSPQGVFDTVSIVSESGQDQGLEGVENKGVWLGFSL